ncbi:hypothetical protein Dthio_PD3522 [Desulfonatronospira thiodismutans ASO3-1]|uniref:Uncharacterized protein n=1 Tax=Desulfonatronospira thiodismutans ASO3-1 TaxID=555779 RepID=D6SN14_9BACT|nr:hypothetical protein Dthio_PD3522 [Desulfonatronospira thiodismutans ASO3-1]
MMLKWVPECLSPAFLKSAKQILEYESYWEDLYYQQKEVTVYYKQQEGNNLILLTVIARYGQNFFRG